MQETATLYFAARNITNRKILCRRIFRCLSLFRNIGRNRASTRILHFQSINQSISQSINYKAYAYRGTAFRASYWLSINPSRCWIWRTMAHCFCAAKGAITSKIKHAIKHKTSPARLAQLLQPSSAFFVLACSQWRRRAYLPGLDSTNDVMAAS